jgi:hypothetical protein
MKRSMEKEGATTFSALTHKKDTVKGLSKKPQ